jgi:signal transduction histidine kinase
MSNSRPHEGTGMGLAVAKKLIELMDGHLEIKTSSLGGCAIAITLPRH